MTSYCVVSIDLAVDNSSSPVPCKRPRRKPANKPLRAFMCRTRYPSLVLPTDEFSSQGSDRDYQNNVNGHEETSNVDGKEFVQTVNPATVQASGRCKALYDYDANMYDELTIRTGVFILFIYEYKYFFL